MISPLAVVETTDVGARVTIHEYAVIRGGVAIGDDAVIHPHVVIESGVRIGEGVEIFPGSYLGKRPHGAGATSRPYQFRPVVVVGRGCAIGPNAVVYYDVEIGANTLVGDGASVREQVRIGSRCLISRCVTVNYNTVIGDRTKIMDSTHITGNCEIGEDVFIGMLVSTANDKDPVSREFREETTRGPRIGNGVTIGTGATVLPALVIGEGAVVGAGSVVTRDVAPHDVVVGVPARRVRNLLGESGA